MDYATRSAIQYHPGNPDPISTNPFAQMYHPVHASNTHVAYYSHQSLAVNPNPNLSYNNFPLPSSLISESVSHPPGIDLYPPVSSNPSYNGAFNGQTPYYTDPNALSQNWVVKQAEPIKYPAITNYLNERPTVSLQNDVRMQTPKVVQPVRCELCKIDCNNKDVFEKHILGKKHKNNLQNQNASPAVANLPNWTSVKNLGGFEDIETKARKLTQGGTAADAVRICTICNVVCNSQVVFDKHITGKKHAIQAGLLPAGTAGLVTANAYLNSLFNPSALNHNMKRVPKKPKIVRSQWCEVCKIHLNSSDVLMKHRLGKKHKNNLEKIQNPNQPKNPVIGPMENSNSNSGKSTEQEKPQDLEGKKKKILEGGAKAMDVRICPACSVVCNSQTVFDSHIGGQKHASMVKKKAESGMVNTAPLSENITVPL